MREKRSKSSTESAGMASHVVTFLFVVMDGNDQPLQSHGQIFSFTLPPPVGRKGGRNCTTKSFCKESQVSGKTIILYPLSVIPSPQLHSPVVAAAGDPFGVLADINAEDIAGVTTQGLCK